MNKLINALIIVLAAIAAVVAIGLLAGYTMQPMIVAYWVVLLMKNMADYIKAKFVKKGGRKQCGTDTSGCSRPGKNALKH